MKISKLILSVALFGVLLAFAPKASALTIGDSQYLGYINDGTPAGEAQLTSYVNYLIDMSLGAGPVSALGQTFTRSLNNFGPLVDAEFISRTTTGFTGNTVDVTGGYQYLAVKYDGPNWGTEVWYIGNLSGTFTVPRYPNGDQQLGISGYTYFTRTPGTNVPDAGSTALLLGAALSGLGLIARRNKKS